MQSYIKKNTLDVDSQLVELIEKDILPNTNITAQNFWECFSNIVDKLTPINEKLLEKRDNIQIQIDDWHKNNTYNVSEYESFLKSINYLVEPPEDFSITTEHVDEEIATMAGPQLVVPVNNARFALNAANARWGSLFDAFYGTDIIDENDGCEKSKSYNPKRGAKVVQKALDYLDQLLPIINASHCDVSKYSIIGKNNRYYLEIYDTNNQLVSLKNQTQFLGFSEHASATHLLFINNGLHFEVVIDPNDTIGKTTTSNIKDIILESALTTIADCEDSVAAVDGADKCKVYENWLGLMQGNHTEQFIKNGQPLTRRLNADRYYTSEFGGSIKLQGRSLLFVRNVGHLMRNPAIIDQNKQWVFEGIMDAVITVLCSLHDLNGNSPYKNSQAGSIYIVKPKMHGPEEVAYCDQLFSEVESAFSLAPNTIKVGVMDEEKRTTVNLKACIEKVKDRIVFINTGFLDRTGDEIHTCMQAGPVVPKEQFKGQTWIQAYENNNVDIGLACGFYQRAQIGKGMWAKPDLMAQMMSSKHIHPQAGANCAWVPSPTAATLHALHYHQNNVSSIQQELKNREPAQLQDLLTLPLMDTSTLTNEMIDFEIENNLQSILGYVVRWIDNGIGCSKVLDIHNEGLMEDRATLRISSQLLANWLLHDIISQEQIMHSMKKMAKFVDDQNKHDPSYIKMCDDFENNIAVQSALELVLNGVKSANGYTEPSLHAKRLEFKNAM